MSMTSSSVYIVNHERILNFFLIIYLEQENVCWGNIEKINPFEDKVWHTCVMLQ